MVSEEMDLKDQFTKGIELKQIERSIIKTYRKHIWARFIQGINEFELLEDGDRVAVAISGGKDSLLLAKCMQEVAKYGRQDIELEFLAMDPGYRPEIRRLLEMNCEHLGIPVKIFDSDVFEVADKLAQDNPCYMCARMRRGFLYGKAEELGCNKLALGHHFNDVIETIMLNVLCSANYMTMMPKLRADNFENMEIIRPLYYVREKDIIRWMNNTELSPLDCACTVAAKDLGSKRQEIKELIEELGESFADVDMSIFRSAQNVNLNGIIGWEKDREKHSFLEEY